MKSKTIRFENKNGTDLDQWNKAVEAFREWSGKGEIVIRRPTRTPAQNNSLHLYCEWIAVRFNENHIPYVENYLGKEFEEDWTMGMVKEKIFKRALYAKFKKEKTSKATTSEISWVVDYIEKNLALKLKIDLAFPNKWDLLNK